MNFKTLPVVVVAITLTLGLFSFTPAAQAKVFSNAYVSFELADRWNCALEQTEWVCRTNQPGLAEAIIILTAKEVGPQDALSGYEGHLKSPRTIMSRAGSPIQSTVYKVEQRTINKQPWIDDMHLSSEVPNYYTRYVATTKDKIAVLVTFSAHKTHYTKYSSDFFRAIESLKAIASRSIMNGSGPGGAGGNGDRIGQPTNIDLLPDQQGGVAPDEGSGGGGNTPAGKFAAIAVIVGAVGVYLLLKKGGKGGGSGKTKKRRRPS